MISLIVVLVLLSFLQGALLPYDVVFLVIITRSFVTDDQGNFWLAFGFGIFLSLLLGFSLGSLSILYLLAVLLVRVIRRLELSSHWLAILLFSLFLLGLNHLVRGFLAGSSLFSSIGVSALIVEAVLILPVYLLVQFWEERFIPRSDIRLKLGK